MASEWLRLRLLRLDVRIRDTLDELNGLCEERVSLTLLSQRKPDGDLSEEETWEWRDADLDCLHLPSKVLLHLVRAGVETVGQLADRLDKGDMFHLSEADVRKIRDAIDREFEPIPLVIPPKAKGKTKKTEPVDSVNEE